MTTHEAASPVLAPPSLGALRRELHELVLKDLLGPAAGPEEEVNEARVSDRYLVGMLAPRRQRDRVAAEEIDDLALSGANDENGSVQVPSSLADTLFPSSFGMTFCVRGEQKVLRVEAAWGQYVREHSEGEYLREDGSPKPVWRRCPKGGAITLTLKEGVLAAQPVIEGFPDVYVQGVARRAAHGWMVSLFLVNDQEEPEKLRDAAWLFQPELKVSDPKGEAIFVRRGLLRDWSGWDRLVKMELETDEMVYRRQQEFAVGHGVSVTWEATAEDPTSCRWITTRVVPECEVPATDVPTERDNPALAGLVVDMKVLSEMEGSELAARLPMLTAAYRAWIEVREREVEQLEERFKAVAAHAMGRARRALGRIAEGIALLGRDAQAAEAFRFANRAMWLQRGHSLHARNVRREKESNLDAILDAPANRSWRPFQLAFVLLNLPGLTDLHHEDREIADLLWFPTGGGKTEAYLGLSAYTMALRRLQGVVNGHDGGPGVSVLMRYTLRLLTLQQFQRAATLVCAMEHLRRDAVRKEGRAKWGAEPFRLGLWVGMKTTPNTTKAADEAIKMAKGNAKGWHVGRGGTPLQITNCPWCGRPIGADNVKPSLERRRTVIYCSDETGSCLYGEKQSPGEGLPLLVVDEEIYQRLPAMLIATVDKFAQMPWNGAVQALFGRVQQLCPRHGYWGPAVADSMTHPRHGDLPACKSTPVAPLRPPDLIIQDELHLISGPLGSLVGLYETAVDELCSWEVGGKRVRPKVIASTATIRRAPDQIHAVFQRECEIFPPHGLDIRDNFFSTQRDERDSKGALVEPGRLYLGICAPGKRLKATLIRVYTAYLSAAQALYLRHGAHVDPWMTLVGYFNSLRELGGMRRLVDDDVRTRLRDMPKRGLAQRRPPILEELTSRLPSSSIPRILDRMETGFDPERDTKPLDVLLASNMISVGVDVQRLGLMVVAGQPKTTAEYIQATSRVGRGIPGLVCTVFNWARPRDLSHYEMFEHYHASFYRHVEALSVTPFAGRAIDRGLSALLVSLIRLGQFEMTENSKAQDIDRTKTYVGEVVRRVAERAKSITGRAEDEESVERGLKMRLDEWDTRSKRRSSGSRLGYETAKDGVTVGLLKDTGPGRWDVFTCLNSLRDVEPSVSLILSDKELD